MFLSITMLVLALAELGAGVGAVTTAEDVSETPSRLEISDLAWLQGCWAGEALGGESSECWMAGPDGRLTGMFQLYSDGKQEFTEIFVLDDFGDGPELRLKHFTSDLVGWEEKDEHLTFRLLETSTSHAVFKSLRFRCSGDALDIELDMRMSDGSVRIIDFPYTRTTAAVVPCE